MLQKLIEQSEGLRVTKPRNKHNPRIFTKIKVYQLRPFNCSTLFSCLTKGQNNHLICNCCSFTCMLLYYVFSLFVSLSQILIVQSYKPFKQIPELTNRPFLRSRSKLIAFHQYPICLLFYRPNQLQQLDPSVKRLTASSAEVSMVVLHKNNKLRDMNNVP